MQGLIYYAPQSDGTGEVSVISFTPRPEEEVAGLSVATFDPLWLVEFMKEEPNIGQYRLVFDDAGEPTIDVYKPVIDTGRHQEMFYHVEPYCNTSGIVAKVYPNDGIIKMRVWGYNPTIEESRNQRFAFYITKVMEPNVILRQFTATVGEILDRQVTIEGLPLGEPTEGYSIWTVSPDDQIKVWWNTET